MSSKSFILGTDDRGPLEFFQQNGYVVIDNILSTNECQATLEEIGNELNKIDGRFILTDPSTYDYAPMNGIGIYTDQPIFSRQFLLNRSNPNVYRAFSLVSENPNLIVNHDSCY